MPENKPKADLHKTVAESPISDLFEGRHPAASEKEWAEKTLAPTLQKAPEKPIGSPTGTGSAKLNSTPEELMFFVSPFVFLLIPEPTIWSGRHNSKR